LNVWAEGGALGVQKLNSADADSETPKEAHSGSRPYLQFSIAD